MRTSHVVLFIGAVLLLHPSLAKAELIGGPGVSRGPGVSLLLGGNFCTESRGDSTCEDIDAGFGTSVNALWRFFPYLSVELGFFYAGQSHPDYISINKAGFLVGPRGFFPIGPVDITMGLGLGWGRDEIVTEPDEYLSFAESRLSGFFLGLSFSVSYRITDFISAGLETRYLVPFYDEICLLDDDGDRECTGIDYDYRRSVMFGLVVTGYFLRSPRSRAARREARRDQGEACWDGTTRPCTCPNGRESTQRCRSAELGWSSCDCGDVRPAAGPASAADRNAAYRAYQEAERLERGGDRLGAIRAYQRSFDLFARPDTLIRIINLGEATNDVRLIERACQLYLDRFPSGPHRTDVEARLQALRSGW